MKKIIYTIFACFTALYILTSTIIDPDNPPTGSTGAPGETTCATSDCHDQINTALAGTVEVTGLPSEIEAGKIYPITVKNTSATGKGTGFQLTCLDANNQKCGTFGTATNVSVASANGRDYARNSKKISFTGGTMSWSFNWTAPAIGKTANFYMAAVIGNGDGKEHKDNVVSATKAVNFKTTPTIDEALDSAVKIFPNPAKNFLNIQMEGHNEAEGFLYDAQGRQVKKMYLSSHNNINIQDLSKGNYLLQIKVDGKQTTKKINVY